MKVETESLRKFLNISMQRLYNKPLLFQLFSFSANANVNSYIELPTQTEAALPVWCPTLGSSSTFDTPQL